MQSAVSKKTNPSPLIHTSLWLLFHPTSAKKSKPFEQKSIGQYAYQWLDSCKHRVKQSTYAKYYAILHNHILPAFKELPISELTTEYTQKFSEELLNSKKLSPKTTKDILTVLKTVLKEAENDMNASPISNKIILPKTPKNEIRVLSHSEQNCLASYLMKQLDEYNLGILLSLFTGMRIGEICALKWRNISLSQQVIRVEATMQRIKVIDDCANADTKVLIDTPKSQASIRTIPITAFIAQLLSQFQCNDPEAFLLTGQADRYIEPRTLQYRFAKCVQECGLQDVHFHTLRHTFATRCAEVDFEIKSLSEVLGHSDPRITLDRYVHPSMELKRSNMEKLTDIICK